MSIPTPRPWAAVLAALALASPLLAHDDDPKILDRLPPYEGPGFRRGVGGGSDGVPATSGPAMGFPATNVQLLSWLPLGDLDGAQSGNDCWGYVSGSGREYAIIGTYDGTVFVEVTNPAQPVVRSTIPGPGSLWRDVKTYGQYAYAVSEGGSGIQVMNLAQIDTTGVALLGTVNDVGTSSTHNVAIDTQSGFLYRCGGSNEGLRIYSLANPASPAFVGSWSTRYVHDAQVVTYTSGPLAGRQIAFACSGFNGGGTQTGLDVLDVTNKANVQVLSNVQYPDPAYSHQGWLSADRQYFFLGDELDEDGSKPTTTHVIDVSNPLGGGAFPVTTFTNGNTAIGHNLYTVGDTIYEANYRSGLRVFDATNPLAPVEIASFDTVPDDDADAFNGLWNVYPFLPSGVVLGSDLEKGLFVWWVGDPQLAVTLPGGAPEALSPNGQSVAVDIVESFPGALAGGTETLVYDAGAGPVSLPLAHLGGTSYEATFPALPCGTEVVWFVQAESTGGIPWTNPAVAPAAVHVSTAAVAVAEIASYDMQVAGGWTAGAPGDDATTGEWTRVNPRGSLAQPEDDHSPVGALCWVTGQGPVGGGLGDNDVDNGHTTLLSPVFDLTGLNDPVISYWRWYSNLLNGVVDDAFQVDVSFNGGSSWSSAETVGPNGPGTSGGWTFHSFRLADVGAPTSQVQLRFVATDAGSGSIVEAALDDFRITDADCSDDTLGTRYCSPAMINSTGLPGEMSVTGSAVVSDDDLVLTATQLPTGSNIGYFLMGAGMNTFVPPGSAGPICVAPGLVRYLPPVSNTNELGGGFSRVVGTNGPQSGNITAASTWNFQAWHRDALGGTSNLTDAVSVTFQ